ncbi:MAG: SDR family oxidoreductase [Bacilli bacterium]|nr:SDR family oxidoreductase [Bacilli bacterium]
MKALITGASSGIGLDFAKYLSTLGYDLILVARRKDRLENIKKELKTNVKIISTDLSNEKNCIELYKQLSKEKIDILVNNAGFGDFGEFRKSDLEKELNMINVNIKAVHILTKLFLSDMIKKNSGYILNVASAASFSPGPLMATYYSTKSYVLRLTQSINAELHHNKSNVKISVLCPGPVETEFNDIANVNFSIKPLKSDYVAKYAIDKMFSGKLIIVPGILMKFMRLFSKILPDKFLAKIVYNNQTRKKK